MATVDCSLNTLIRSGKCFNCFSDKELRAAMVYFLNNRLAKLQGVTPQTAGQLVKSSACLVCSGPGMSIDNLDATVAQNGSVAAGNAGDAILTIAQIRAAINPLVQVSLIRLRTIEILLKCQLNAFP